MISRLLLNMFFPPRCIFCGKTVDFTSKIWVCNSCNVNKLKLDSDIKRCRMCSAPLNNKFYLNKCSKCKGKRYFNRVISCFPYRGAIKSAIHRYKFSGNLDFYETMAHYIAKLIQEEMSDIAFDRIVAVPMHRQQLKLKGFNHTGLLAKAISKRLDIRYSKECLIRLSKHKQSLTTSVEERESKVSGSYQLNDIYNFKGESVLIIDDVFTTGSTINECSKVLKKYGGAAKVYGATFAFAVPKNATNTENEYKDTAN